MIPNFVGFSFIDSLFIYIKQWDSVTYSTVDSRYLDFGYLENPLISNRKSDPCFNIEI